jgi:hypothetical protein
VRAWYRRLLAEAHALYDARRAHADSLVYHVARIDRADDEFDRAVAWSIVNLDGRWYTADLGCGRWRMGISTSTWQVCGSSAARHRC